MLMHHPSGAYTAVHRSTGVNPLRKDSEQDDRIYGEVPVDLHRTLTGDGPTFHLSTHDAGATNVQLLFEMAHYSGDEVAVPLWRRSPASRPPRWCTRSALRIRPPGSGRNLDG